ncbi:MAG: four helix bundle protein [Clostridia bacterium]|nr:four helix bundle protein [Clostridia bacterium]
MKDSILREKTKNIAVKILKICDEIDTKKGKGVLINQIVKSSTSIGANVNEANYASSRADFINKLHIALKECYETEYWLEILKELDCVSKEKLDEIMQECGTVRRILVKSINTAKENLK